jgi:hypothetical protein
MASPVGKRPNFKLPIDDPDHFIGRKDLLSRIQKSPCEVRILLGGRRIGKTSVLNAVQWKLLDPNLDKSNRAFPVPLNLHVEQPKDLDNLRYILIARLREAIEKWRRVPGASLREMYRSYLRQIVDGEVGVKFLELLDVKLKIDNPDRERRLIHDDFRRALLKTIDDLRKLQFNGVCFLLDRAEFIASQEDWANDAWGYFRGLKDTDTALKPFLGIFLAGYRELKDYQQEVGSPLLNIADVEWLTPLTDAEALELINRRKQDEKIPLTEKGVEIVKEWTGCHPYLIQQMLDAVYDRHQGGEHFSINSLLDDLLKKHDPDFSKWWNTAQEVGGLSDIERAIYTTLVKHRQGDALSLAQYSGLGSMKVKNALDVLTGTGIIRKLDKRQYKIGARLFEKWVAQQIGDSPNL